VKSRLYEGVVRHRRYTPRAHSFHYRVFMPYLCLDELPELFDRVPLWSARRAAPARYRRADFHGNPDQPLAEAVLDTVEAATGPRPEGPVFLLANLRYWGYIMNPISCYYCFDASGEHLQALVAEVNNTPWDERHAYVVDGTDARGWIRTRFDKAFHVSPFNPMDMEYDWHSNTPGRRLALHMRNRQQGATVFDASMVLTAQPLTDAALVAMLWRYPLMTAKVATGIYWQALRLWLKGTPLHSHPATRTGETRT